MRTELFIAFRQPKQDMIPLLPPDLLPLIPAIYDEENRFGKMVARCLTNVDEAAMSRIIEWGRQKKNGQSLIDMVVIHEWYDIADLARFPLVEIFLSKDVDELSKTIRRDDVWAYVKTWECTYCRRSDLKQLHDLEVAVFPDLDFQMATVYEWLVTSRVEPVLTRHGVKSRPLKNNRDVSQMVIENSYRVVKEVWPIEARNLCPVCGLFSTLFRKDLLEGDYDVNDEIAIVKDSPLTIHLDEGKVHPLAKCDLEFGRFEHIPEAKPGQEPDFSDIGTASPEQYYFMASDLVRDLLEMTVVGINFRPVNIID